MNSQVQTKTSETVQAQGFIADAKVYMNQDRGTLTHLLGNEMRIEMPINLYKKILGLPFEKAVRSKTEERNNRSSFGLVATPSIFLSKDGQYLVHRVLGIRVSKHINYYKQIFGVEYTPKARPA
ncbi:MAG: hypothetical protein ACK5V3_00505 [Bdellovibrionales bacterium]